MPVHAAFLRAVNVGGTGKLPMALLKRIAEDCGLRDPKTYLASGNLVGTTPDSPKAVRARLEERLAREMSKPVRVHVRSQEELEALLAANPYPEAPGARVLVLLLDTDPDPASPQAARHRTNEEIATGPRCLFAHFPTGQAASRLVLPGAEAGTARNINTLTAVLDLMRSRAA